MKSYCLTLLLPFALIGALASCNSQPVLTEIDAITVHPVLAELDTCAYLGLYCPVIETFDGARYDPKSDFKLFDDNGEQIAWHEFGIRESVTLYASSDGKIAKGVVHGDLERSIYMWSGQTFYDSGYVFFKGERSIPYLYSSNCTEDGYPKHVAMKVQGKVQVVDSVIGYLEGCDIPYSPNPHGFRGYVVFDE